MIRAALVSILLAGCSVMPETPDAPYPALAEWELDGYSTEPVEPVPAVEIPQPDGVTWTLTFQQMARIEDALAVADANTAALRARNEQVRAMALTMDALLRAGRMAEKEAELYHRLYVAEVRQGFIDKLVSRGVTGLALILLVAGAL